MMGNTKTTNIIAIAGLIISLIGNVILFKSNQIASRANDELQKENTELRNIYKTKVDAIQRNIAELEAKNESLEMTIAFSGNHIRNNELKLEIIRNKEKIRDLRVQLSEINLN